jgi:YVTN family beta-propeller protein
LILPILVTFGLLSNATFVSGTYPLAEAGSSLFPQDELATSTGARATGGNLAPDRTQTVELPRATNATNTTNDTISVGTQPSGATYDPFNGFVYVTNFGSNDVSIINGTATESTVGVGEGPSGAAFDSANGYVYVTNFHSDNLSLINGTVVVGTITLEGAPTGVAFDSLNGYVYVTDCPANFYECNSGESGSVLVLNGTSIIATVPVVAEPYGATFDPNSGYVYITACVTLYSGCGARHGNLSVINGTSVVATLPVGLSPAIGPSGAAVDPATGIVYVTSFWGGNVTLIDGLTVVGSIFLDQDPVGIAYDSVTGYVYVADASENVSVINGSSLVATLPETSWPIADAFDPANQYVYVANYDSNNVAVLNGSVYYPTISSFTATPSTVEVNSTTNPVTSFDVSAGGGEGPLTFAYVGLPAGCTTTDVSSLVCKPTVWGTYNVVVYVNNSGGYGPVATTALTVLPSLSATATAAPNRTDVGSPVQFSLDRTGGTGVDSYAWEFGDGNSSTVEDPAHAYASVGNYTARVWVNDTDGGTTFLILPSVITVFPQLTAVLSVSNSTPVLGQSISINVVASGGAPPYSYLYVSLPPGCGNSGTPTIGCLPTQAGVFNLSVVVTDQNGIAVTATIPFQVIFDFTLVAPSQDTVHQPFTISVVSNPGYGKLTYAYSGLPSGCASVSAPEVTCTPTQVETIDISVTASDTAGGHATQRVKVDVVPAGPLSILETPPVLGGLITGALVVIVVALVLYARRRDPAVPESAKYAAYRLPSSHGAPSGSDQAASRPDRGTGTDPGLVEQGAPGEDSLTDLV